jgi:hypothetical protein
VFTRTRVLAYLFTAALVVPIAACCGIPCRFDGSGLPYEFNRGTAPHTSVIYCDIEKERRCAEAADVAVGIDITMPSFSHEPTVIGLDLSADAVARCGANGEAIVYHDSFPRGTPICVGTDAVPGLYSTVDTACVAFCSGLGDLDNCGQRAKASTGASAPFPDACSDSGAIRPNFDDPREDATPTPTPTATVTPTPTPEVTPGVPVTWTALVNVTAMGNTLVKTTADGWDGGGISVQTLGSGDGFVEFTATENATARLCGLGTGNTGPQENDVDFGIHLAGGNVYINENGNQSGSLGPYFAGDVFRVAVDQGLIRYSRNGAALPSTPRTPTYPLRVDTSLYTQNAQITNAIVYFPMSLTAAPRPVAAALAGSRRQALTLDNPEGELKIHLDVEDPFGTIDKSSPISEGRVELISPEGDVSAPTTPTKRFILTQASLRFRDFTISKYFNDVHHRQVAVQLRNAVPFTATSVGAGLYEFSIPETEIGFYGGAIVDGGYRSGFDQPRQPVTGKIDLNTGAFEAKVVMDRHASISIIGFDLDLDGTLTVNMHGTLTFPDTDGDGVPDKSDNCRLISNPDQAPVASPTISAPADITLASCRQPQIGTATAKDVCNGGPVTITNDAPSVFPLGSRTVVWTATDSRGQTATDTQLVTVADTTRPVFTFVPAPVTVTACGPVDLHGPAIATDDCGPTTVTNDAPAYFPSGSTVVTWTARDVSGNVRTATQVVTVNDTTPPVFTHVPPPVTITTCVNASIGQAQASDSCGVTVTNDAPAKFPLGPTTVTWMAIDGAGNVGTVTQRVTAELGDDATCCPTGTHLILGTAGGDTIVGTAGSDCILTRDGDDTVDARDGNDFVSGGAGRDVLGGGLGNDLLNGRTSDDVIDGGPGNDKIDGGPGYDTCAGGTGTNQIKGCEQKTGG